jgi:hypothetical protein
MRDTHVSDISARHVADLAVADLAVSRTLNVRQPLEMFANHWKCSPTTGNVRQPLEMFANHWQPLILGPTHRRFATTGRLAVATPQG